MEHFTPLASTVGGVLIGLSASMLLLFSGRIAGVSGIAAGLLTPARGDSSWRVAFLGGLVVAGGAMFAVEPAWFAMTADRSMVDVAIAGVLVGLGVRFGSGCTSGHGVCGISRLSPRSLVATVTFIVSGAVTVAVYGALGGAS